MLFRSANVDVSNIKVAVFGLPGFASSAANDFTSQIFDLNRLLSEQGIATEQLKDDWSTVDP